MSTNPDIFLDALMDAAEPPAPRGGIAKLRYTHDAMVDQILANPSISQNQLAAMFGYTPSWISQIITSDAFQARLSERSRDTVDPILRASIEEQFKGIVARSLEVLREKLDKPAAQIPDNLALRTLEISARGAGYGVRDQTNIQVNVGDHLEVLGENLTKLLQRKRTEVVAIDLGETE